MTHEWVSAVQNSRQFTGCRERRWRRWVARGAFGSLRSETTQSHVPADYLTGRPLGGDGWTCTISASFPTVMQLAIAGTGQVVTVIEAAHP